MADDPAAAGDPGTGAAGDPSGGAGGGGGGGGDERKFTQADLDHYVKERLARDRKDRPSDEEISQLREQAKRLQDIEDQSKSQLEREQQAREQAEKAAEQAQRERDEVLAKANARLIEAAVIAEGAAQKALRPDHLHRLIDTGSVTVGDDGQVTGVQEAVKAFLEANPEYVGTGRATGSADQGARGDSGSGKQVTKAELATMSPEEIALADKEGRLTALASGSMR